MANFPKMVLTSKGVSLQAKVQGGAQLALTRMALGDGQLGGTPISGLNALVSQKVTLPLTGGKRVSTQTYQVEAFFSNTTISTGFWWREWGVFATDPDVGEILYCYANTGDAGDYIAPATDTRIEKYLYASMAVGNASNITVEVSSSDIYITAQDLAAHAEDTTKHIGTTAKTTPVDADSLALVDSADGSKLKRLTWATLKAALGSVFATATHNHSGVYEPAFTKNSAFNKVFETLVSNIKMNGAASVGSSNNVARADHIHPVDTSRAAASHKSQHATGGTDALAPADIGAAPSAHTHDDRYFTEQETISYSTKASFGKLASALPNDIFAQLSEALLIKNKKSISTLDDGAMFYLTEGGVKVPFIKLKNNYEGSGRTLVIRQTHLFNTTTSMNYSGSPVDSYLSGTYLNTLSTEVKNDLANVNIPYTTSGVGGALTTLARKIFSLSLAELGGYADPAHANMEGTAIPYFNSNARRNTGVSYWTRTPFKAYDQVYIITNTGSYTTNGTSGTASVRPALTLSANFEVEIDPSVTDILGKIVPLSKLATGSYVGTGATGASNPVTLVLPFIPKFICISIEGGGSSALGNLVDGKTMPLNAHSQNYLKATLSGTMLNWVSGYNDNDASYRFNYSGAVYHFTIIG